MTIPGNRFAYYRKKHQLTQADVLAEIQKVTGKKFRQGTISSWENGKTVPEMQILQIMASLFNVKVDDLYEKPESVKTNKASGIALEKYERKIDTISEVFDKGDTEQAFHEMEAISKDLIHQLAKAQEEIEKLKGKLRTAQDVLNL